MKQPSRLDTTHFISLYLDELQAKVLKQSYENQLAKQIPVFSTLYLSDISTRIIKNFVDDGGGKFIKQPIDVQPQALIQDNFMPSSINSAQPPTLITQPPKPQPSIASTRKRISSLATNLQQQQQQQQKSSKRKSIAQGQISQNLIPLKIQQHEEDRIVKFLREKKQTEDKELSINKESTKKQSKKDTNKEKKPMAVTYDFNGEVIQVRGTQPSNLVRNGLQAVIDSNIQLNSFRDSNARENVQLDVNRAKNQVVKKRKWVENTEQQDKEQEEEVPIEPLVSIPVQTFDICEGARITTVSGQLNERSKRDLSTEQLLEKYKKIKLSKSQYQRIREIEARQQSMQKEKFNQKGNSVQKSQQKKVEKPNKKRSNSVIDLKHHKHKGEKILVSNQQLKETYLKYPVQEQTSILNATQQKQNTTQFHSNTRDEQLQFLLKKQGTNPGMIRTRTVLVLPEIKHKLAIGAVPLKARERVKNQKQLLGEFHKKFQERLRLTSIKN